MKNVANFLLFQLVWFVTVGGAAQGWMWPGPAAALAFVAVHLATIGTAGERRRELAFVLVAGSAGTLLDSGLEALGATAYPTSGSAWPYAVVPPWITALWVAFALLPRYSLRWLGGRVLLAAVFGCVGGPLSYLAGTRFGAVAVGDEPLLTWGVLALEYAALTPLLLRWAPAGGGS